ncbi:hypothetical protein QBA75_27275 [Streptomyces stelliscabiei]
MSDPERAQARAESSAAGAIRAGDRGGLRRRVYDAYGRGRVYNHA